jgi:branched-chain amino acid transport system substrate-binding protein
VGYTSSTTKSISLAVACTVGFFMCALSLSIQAAVPAAKDKKPVLIGFDGAYSQLTNTAAAAIELGTKVAIDEINARGGVLGGRPLALVTRDNHGVAARARNNFRELAAQPDLVAIYSGKFSPTTIETMPLADELKVISVGLWGSASPITSDPQANPFVYRLSLNDAWAIPAMMAHARDVFAATRLCMLAPNTAWGRSGAATLEMNLAKFGQQVAYSRWYSWGEREFDRVIDRCQSSGGQAIFLIANEGEAAALINDMAARAQDYRLPIVAHWGLTGGQLHEMIGENAKLVRLDIIQTFSFVGNPRPVAQGLAQVAMARTGVSDPALISSPVGVAQAYDMTHLLALAIDRAGSANRTAVQAAMQDIARHDGAIRLYDPAFSSTNHDGLTPAQVLFVNLRPDGALIPVRQADTR